MTNDGPQTKTLNAGDKLGPFTIAGIIATTDHSIVYRGRDQLLNRDVAIKQVKLLTAQDPATFRQNLKRQAERHKNAAAGDPKHIVNLIDVFDEPRGLFIVTEFVNGPTLAQILEQLGQPMDLKQAVGILAASAQALTAIHGCGMLHRNLKPSNILLPRQGGLKLTDFGLAAASIVEQKSAADSAPYLAPELLKNQPVDARTDLYALGMIGYEMLLGRRQFEQTFDAILRAPMNQAARWADWHQDQQTEAVPLKTLRPELPQTVSDLVAWLMKKDPQQRAPSSAAVLEVIRQHIAAAPALQTTSPAAPQPVAQSRAEQADSPVTRPPFVLGIVAVVVVIVAMLLGIYALQQRGAARERAATAAEQIMTSAEQAYADGDYVTALNRYQEVVNTWPNSTAIGRRAERGVLLSQSQMATERGEYEQAQALLTTLAEKPDTDAQRIEEMLDDVQQRQAFAQAGAEVEQAIADTAFDDAQEKIQALTAEAKNADQSQQIESLKTKLAEARINQQVVEVLAQVEELLEADRRPAAISALETALQRQPHERLQQRHDELVAAQTFDEAVARGRAAVASSDLAAAITAFETALAQRDDAELSKQLNDLRSRASLVEGLQLMEAGDLIGAEIALTRSMGYAENAEAGDALQRIGMLNRRNSFIEAGDQAMNKQDYPAAIEQYQQALEVEPGADVQAKLNEAKMQIVLGRARAALAQGELTEAREIVTEGESVNPEHEELIALRNEVVARQLYMQLVAAGDAALERKEYGEAKRMYRKAADLFSTPDVRSRLDKAEYDHLLAQARSSLDADQFDSAEALLRTALQIRESDQALQMLAEIESRRPRRETP